MLSLLDTVVAAETCEEVRPFADAPPPPYSSPYHSPYCTPSVTNHPAHQALYTPLTPARPPGTKLFTPSSPHIVLALNGAEIITNGSGCRAPPHPPFTLRVPLPY